MMKMIHSYWAYFVLALLIYSVVNALINANKDYKNKDKQLTLLTLIASHIQLLLGLGWYFMSPVYKSLKTDGMGEIMKDSDSRLLAVEHPILMLIAILVITIGFAKHRNKTSDIAKHKTILIWYGIALLLILARIPWAHWF